MAILVSPLPMVDNARRNFVQLEIDEFVAAHDHCAALLAERVDNPLQCRLRAVEVVTVELDSVSTTSRIVDRQRPTTADTQRPRLRYYMNEARFVGRNLLQFGGSAVGRMVVDHDYIIVEISRLRQSASDSIGNRRLAVVDRYDDRCLDGKFLVGIRISQLRPLRQPATFGFQVIRKGLLHFDLHLAVGFVDVSEMAVGRRLKFMVNI